VNWLAYNTLIVLAGTSLLGIVAGVLGSYMVLRRRALLGDALSHAAYPGLGLAFLITGQRHFGGLLTGAFATALIGSWTVGAIRRHTRVKEDAAIGIVLSVFFGLGVVVSRIVQNTTTTGSKAGLDSFIFGKSSGMVAADVRAILLVGVVVLAATLLLAKEFRLLAFDPDFGRVQGWPILLLDIIMMSLVCVTTIVGLPAVGVVLMAALLIIPGAAARFWTDRLGRMLWLAGLFGGVAGACGTLASAWAPSNVGAGPVIILTAAGCFLFSMLAAPRRGAVARVLRHVALARRVAMQNLLRTLYELSEPAWPDPAPLRPGDLTAARSWSAAQARRLLRRAAARGWVEPSGDGWRLTGAGWQRAAEVTRAHRLWEIFLIEEAQVAPTLVDRDAEQVEHVLEPATVRHLEQRLAELGLVPQGLGAAPRRHAALEELEEAPS